MQNNFRTHVQELNKHVNEISALIDLISKKQTNYNPTIRAINQKLADIDALKMKIYDYIDKNLNTIETNPDYQTYQAIQKKYIDSLMKYDNFLSPPMSNQR